MRTAVGLSERRLDEREVLRAVVVQDEEAVLAADHGVLDRILDELAAWPDGDELGLRVERVGVEHLRGDRTTRADEHELVAAAPADAEPKAFVRFVIDLLGGQPGAKAMAPHGVGTPRVVDGDVVEGAVVRRPRATSADPDDRVVVGRTGAQVPERHRVPLVADHVDRIREDVAVEADRSRAEREELVPVRLDVLVEQYLLAGDLGVLVELRRSPVSGIAYGTTAMNAVLLAFEAAAVIPPLAATDRHRQVGLLGARLDLVEDLLPQGCQLCRLFLGVAVLGLEVGDHLGVGLVAQPFVRVDEDVTVVLAAMVDALGDGWRPGHLAPIQSLKFKPEMRS